MPRAAADHSLDITPTQAKYVLDSLVRQRRVSPGEVARILDDMQTEIAEVTARLQLLRSGLEADASRGRRGSTRSALVHRTVRRQKPVSAETLASRQLQGRYLGLIRQVPERGRARIKKVARQQGREAAIKAMLTLRA